MIRQRLLAATLFSLVVLLTRPPMGTAYVTVGYAPQRTDFSVSFRDETSPYCSTPLFLLPGENVTLKITADAADASFVVTNLVDVTDAAKIGVANARRLGGPAVAWTLTAPEKTGTYVASLHNVTSGARMDLHVFVLVPFTQTQSGVINGYRIGAYPRVPAAKRSLYGLPRGFVEVTPENKDLFLTPHFKLSQFLCKQSGSFPQYVVLRERLLFKLEYVLEHVNKQGIPARTFSVMSGYRTPYYNRALGNVKYSRHMWGDAADIFVANDPRATGMDDLNADGKKDIKDAELLYEIVNELNDEPTFQKFVGGLGRYKPTSAHGPFVHVDARGARANWGNN